MGRERASFWKQLLSDRRGGARIRIVITTAGSRGDVQPCVALGLGLERAGHQVTVATWAPFRKLVEDNGLSFRPVAGPDPDRLMAALVEAGSNPLEFAGRFRGLLRPHVRRGFYDCLAACRDADAIVYTPLGFAGYMVAELLRLPAVGSVVEPLFVRTGRFPSAMLGRPPGGSTLVDAPGLGRLYNHVTHLVVEQLYWRTSQPLVADLRADVGLPQMPPLLGPLGRMHRQHSTILLGWSRRVLPENPDREAWMRTTGYWFLDGERDWKPPRELRAFLEAGEPPVSLALGSLSNIESARTDRIFALTVRSLERLGRRGILLGGEKGGLPNNIINIPGEVPYDWLFWQVAAVVHHGGAGTTAAALKAGVPSVFIPVLPDQAFWAWRMAALGAGPDPIPPRRLTAERLASAVQRATTDVEMRRRCRELGEKISAEDGVGRAVEAFEEHIGKRRRYSS
jgi:sterol 3beta-glucosyltransferase